MIGGPEWGANGETALQDCDRARCAPNAAADDARHAHAGVDLAIRARVLIVGAANQSDLQS